MAERFIKLEKVKNHNPNDAGLEEGYVIEGYLLEEPRVGLPLYIFRTKKNGEARTGYFNTSLVLQVEEDVVATANSFYQITNIEESEDDKKLLSSWRSFPV